MLNVSMLYYAVSMSMLIAQWTQHAGHNIPVVNDKG